MWELRSPGPQFLTPRLCPQFLLLLIGEVGERKGVQVSQKVGNTGCFPFGGFPGRRLPPTQGSLNCQAFSPTPCLALNSLACKMGFPQLSFQHPPSEQ